MPWKALRRPGTGGPVHIAAPSSTMSCFCCRLWLPPSCRVLEICVPLLFRLCKACVPWLEIEPSLDLGAAIGSMLADCSFALPHPTWPVSKAKNFTALHAHRLNLLFGFLVLKSWCRWFCESESHQEAESGPGAMGTAPAFGRNGVSCEISGVSRQYC